MGMTVPYVVAQSMQDEDSPSGRQNYWKAGNLRELTDGAIEVLAERAPTVMSPHCQVMVLLLGGAMGRVGETDTAYCGRDAVFNVSIDNIWEDPSENEAQIAWSRAFYDALTPHLSGGVYLNWASEESTDRVRHAYGANYDRLVALKDQYDPTNFFRKNQNIRPSA
jgi:FAD/FMN-containing dehydrogenase